MKCEPHDYQVYASEYIKEHDAAAVFLECGLGKTSITLTAVRDLMFDRFEIHKVLIIGPIRVVTMSWPDEIKKWDHTSDFRYSVAVGTETERMTALEAKADIYLINRENVQWLVEKSGLPFDYDMVVVDELSSFKNWQAKRFKALMKVRPKVKRIVGLTGTPSSNGLMDLFAEYKLLDMGQRLGRFIGQYRNRYFVPDKTNGHVVYSYKPLPGAEEAIYDRISDITISMKALDYLDMPDCIYTQHYVEMDKKEREYYDRLRRDLIIPLEDADIDAANAASLTGKLLQMANGAVYDENGNARFIHERKLDALEDLIEAANGQPVLIAYWFKHDRQRIALRLAKMGITARDIKESQDIKDWNNGKIPVALLHPASAGHGLNIQQGGHILIWFGLTWSLELYQQTNARLWRQGQSETVTIHHIICKDTVDEDVMAALEKKDITQEKLIAAVKARLY